jgi:hypothetical protein
VSPPNVLRDQGVPNTLSRMAPAFVVAQSGGVAVGLFVTTAVVVVVAAVVAILLIL